jgi:hypothetical protein
VIGSKDEPSAEGESCVDEDGAEEESEDVGGRSSEGEDEDVVRAEEAEVAEDAEPDEEVADPEEDGAHVPRLTSQLLVLDLLLEGRANDDEHVIQDDEQVPEVEEFKPVPHTQIFVEITLEK